jgi:hypothetical protein
VQHGCWDPATNGCLLQTGSCGISVSATRIAGWGPTAQLSKLVGENIKARMFDSELVEASNEVALFEWSGVVRAVDERCSGSLGVASHHGTARQVEVGLGVIVELPAVETGRRHEEFVDNDSFAAVEGARRFMASSRRS